MTSEKTESGPDTKGDLTALTALPNVDNTDVILVCSWCLAGVLATGMDKHWSESHPGIPHHNVTKIVARGPNDPIKDRPITDHETRAIRADNAARDRNPALLHYRGPFRIYFNRKADAPRIVSIDNGSHSWEINCKAVSLLSRQLKSAYHSANEYPDPVFVLEGYGSVFVDENGTATIS